MKLCGFFLLCLAFGLVTSQYNAPKHTEKEIQMARKLRPELKPQVTDNWYLTDDFLIPFIRARKHDSGRAKTMIENTLKWRKDENIDGLMTEDFSDLERGCNMKAVHTGVDKEGRPIIFQNVGGWDLRKCALAGHMNRMVRWVTRHFLEGNQRYKRKLKHPVTGANITQFHSVSDLATFNLRQGACLGCLPFWAQFAYTIETYYPGCSVRWHLLNTPRAFQPVLEIVKPILTEATNKGLKPWGFDKNEWRAGLLTEIDIEQLPVQLGGMKKETPEEKAIF